MRRHFSYTNWVCVPFHLNKTERSLELDDTIELFDDPLTAITNKMKRFAHQNSVGLK